MVGYILSMNQPMLALCEKLGFTIGESPDDPGARRATLVLAASPSAR
jgi:hypothetical protein